MASYCGCYYLIPSAHANDSFPQRQYLPLLQSSFHSTILSNTSRTLLTQTFTNLSKDNPIAECNYTFPLYDGVSVVAFTCRVGETILHGIVKEKFQAKQVFDETFAKGETAGLFEQSTDASDVFNTKLGNIPGGETVFVEITYIGELKASGGEGTRFTIPTSIAPRYGSNGDSSFGSAGPAQVDEGIKIAVDINIPDGSFIKGIQSPSHPIAVTIGTISTATNTDPVMSKASVTFALGETALEKDFVLIIQAKDAGLPKALLETHPTLDNQRAIMATLIPKFSLPPCRPEVVFVADRSGSMAGNIPQLKQAMKVFVKSMPAGVKFNVCSYGSECSFLWKQSHTYNQSTLDEAYRHVETFQANMGGTETLKAITATINQRLKDIPLEAILLTDGDIARQEELFKYLNQEVETSKGSIRVFTLGIGSGVSHSLIEGVARAGNGFSQAVQNGERLDSSVVRMLRGALSPHITNYTLEVKYGRSDDDEFDIIDTVTDGMKVLLNDKAPAEKHKISLFDSTAKPEVGNIRFGAPNIPEIQTPKLLQAPHKIPSLFPFSRTSAYILMSPETIQRNPTSIIFKAISEHGPLELEIPIEVLPEKGQTVHQLAAKKATQDLEEGRGWIFDAKDQDGQLLRERYPSTFNDLVEKEGVRLGEKFQIASKWCSFIAIAANCKQTATAARPSRFMGNSDVVHNFNFDTFLADESAFDSSNPAQSSQPDPQGRNLRLQDYQMQLMLLERQNQARKKRSLDPQDSAQSSQPAPQGRNLRLQDYQMQLMLLERQNQARKKMAMDPQGSAQSSAPAPQGRNLGLKDYQMQLMLLEQQNQKQKQLALAPQDPATRSPTMPRGNNQDAFQLCSVRSPRSSSSMPQPMGRPGSQTMRSKPPAPEVNWKKRTLLEKLHAIVALQNFDGSWPTERISEINEILGKEVGENAHAQLWLTTVLVNFMEIKIADESETWELVVEKARGWMVGVGDMGLEGLETEAKKFVDGL